MKKKKKGKQDNEPQKEIKHGGGWIRYYSAETEAVGMMPQKERAKGGWK